jgi:hypothetical protein
MPDPSPDTPSVCPTCGSDKRNVRNNMDPRRIHPDWCEDTWHDAPATPAAPGSSSPDTAALVAELRGPSGLASTSRAKHLTVGVCAVAADALEAQASRITELEQFLIRLGHNPVTWIAASISGEDPAEYAVPGTVTCTAATHDHPNQESL